MFIKGLEKRSLFGTKKKDYRTEFGIKMCRITRVFLKWGAICPNNPTTYLFPTIQRRVKCVPSATSKLPLRYGSVGIPDCTSVTAEPVSISIFVWHPSILPTTAIRSLPGCGSLRVVITSPPS
ncbi:hypothetical protein T06_14912 [Trichinella sp. T6]|nr:hypothetical protein T06_14912 [Trichinella sp. T6]